MDTLDLLQRVRRIEIKSRALSNNIFAGEYHSAFKGRGMSFAEVREYQPGDDVRDIDWNVTARFNKPYVKVYEEERELTVMLLIDVSQSLGTGSQVQIQRDLAAEIAATIAFSAIQNNDKIGVMLFTNKVEKFISPKKGRKHILHIIRELLHYTPTSTRTDIAAALEYMTLALKRRCTTFILSDFQDSKDYYEALRIAGRKHDMVAIRLYDRRMAELPDVGLMRVVDAETGHEHYIDTSSKRVRDAHAAHWTAMHQRLSQQLNQSRIDHVSVRTDEDFVKALKQLFAKRT